MQLQNHLKVFPRLETSRLILCKCSMKDAQQFFELASDNQLTKYTMWKEHEDIEYTKKYILRLQSGYSRASCYTWAIKNKENNDFMGLISLGITPKHYRAEVGYWIGVPYWNKSYMTQALQEILNYGFKVLGLNKIFAQHFENNLASGAVMKKCNMKFEGTNRSHVFVKGVFHDCHVYSLLKREWKNL